MMRRLCGAALALFVSCAAADERQELEALRATTLNLIRLLVREGVLTQDKADALIGEAEKKPAPETAEPGTPKPVVRVPYVPETVRQQIREEIKQDVLALARAERWAEPNALPQWLDRIALDGDLRLRFQQDRFQSDNAPAVFFQFGGANINSTTEDRNRFRLRARVGLQAKVNEWLSGGTRLTTGSGDPLSTNQTLGSNFNKYAVFIDRAYVRLDPTPWLTALGGRIPNPWFGTDLVWNENLGFEGAALTLKPLINPSIGTFFTVGAFPLQEIENAPTTRAKDKWLYGAQAGFEWAPPGNSRLKVGLGLYDYRNTRGIPNAFGSTLYDSTAPAFRQKGNTLFNIDNDGDPTTVLFALAPAFRNVNLTAALDLAHFDPVHVVLTGDYVRNVGFDRAEILSRTGIDLEPQVRGYYGRVLVGMPQLRDLGDWQFHVAYKYLQRDAVLDAYTDSDFHLGGTNAKGYIVGASYGLGRNAWLTGRWLSAREISGAPLSIDVLQLDFNARF
jgi:hypothetical protein